MSEHSKRRKVFKRHALCMCTTVHLSHLDGTKGKTDAVNIRTKTDVDQNLYIQILSRRAHNYGMGCTHDCILHHTDAESKSFG